MTVILLCLVVLALMVPVWLWFESMNPLKGLPPYLWDTGHLRPGDPRLTATDQEKEEWWNQ